MNRKIANILILAVLMVFVGSFALLSDSKTLTLTGKTASLGIQTRLIGADVDRLMENEYTLENDVLPGEEIKFTLEISHHKDSTIDADVNHQLVLDEENMTLFENGDLTILINSEEIESNLISDNKRLELSQKHTHKFVFSFSEDLDQDNWPKKFELNIITNATQTKN